MQVAFSKKPLEEDHCGDACSYWRDGSQTFEVTSEGTDQANFDITTR